MSTVDIVTPAYDAAGTIGETIQSVLAQRYTDWRLWVIDDGSRDETASVVQQHAGDGRVRLLQQPNRGAAHARNLGIERSSGRYIAFLDADDHWEPDFLAKLVPVLESDDEIGLAWSEMEVCGDGSGLYRGERAPIEGAPEATVEAIYSGVTFLPSCTLFRRSFFAEGMRWTQETSPMEDMPIFMDIASRSTVAHVPLTLSHYRMSPGSSTTSRGAIGRNYRTMLYTFDRVYRDHRRFVSRRAYRHRRWYILHCAADNLLCEGRFRPDLLLRALASRPGAAVTWKVLLVGLWRWIRRSR